MKKYAISIVADKGKYLYPTIVLLNSLHEYTNLEDIDIYVFTDDIKATDYPFNIRPTVIQVDANWTIDLVGTTRGQDDNYKKYTSMKILALDYLKSYETVLMLDADVMITKEVHSYFYNFNDQYRMETPVYPHDWSELPWNITTFNFFTLLNMKHFNMPHKKNYKNIWNEHQNQFQISYDEYYTSKIANDEVKVIPDSDVLNLGTTYMKPSYIRNPPQHVLDARNAHIIHCGEFLSFHNRLSFLPFTKYLREMLKVKQYLPADYLQQSKDNTKWEWKG